MWFNKTFLFYSNFNLILFFYLLKAPVDIIVSNDLDTLLACSLASKIRRKKLVFDSHELFTELPELVSRPFVRSIWKLNEKLLLPGVKFGYTVSKPIQDYYKNKYRKDFLLVRNASMFRREQGFRYIPENLVIIYQGFINVGRGLELMLNTLHLLSNVNLWIVGGGEIVSELKELAKNLHVEKQVVFWGRVRLEELAEITSQAHIGISLEEDLGLNYRYALPNKLFDYIQARIPVIVSDLPEMKLLVTDYKIGCVLEERTPDSLAAIIKNLQSDLKSQEEIFKNLEFAARELCWQKEEEKIIGLYHDLSSQIGGHIS